MFTAILRSAAANARRLLYIWLAVLVANQLFIFGACFAPYCLAAAVPHTLAIAILVNFFGFGRDETDKKKPVVSSPSQSVTAGLAADPPELKRPAANKDRAGPIILCALIAGCIILALVTMGDSRSPVASTAGDLAAVESFADATPEGEVPDERAPVQEPLDPDDPTEEIPDERAPPQEVLYPDDPTEEVPDERAPVIARQGSAEVGEDLSDEHTSLQPYRCVNSSGKMGNGTGRTSRDREYSAFLGRSVDAGEFVIFQYQGSAKQYWFKRSNCQRL